MRMLFKSVLAQSVILVAAAAFTVNRVVGINKCTGNDQFCSQVRNSTSKILIATIIGTAILYGILSLLAYFAAKRNSKVLSIILLLLEAFILLSSLITLTKNSQNGSLLSGVLGSLTSAVVIYFCVKTIKNSKASQPAQV